MGIDVAQWYTAAGFSYRCLKLFMCIERFYFPDKNCWFKLTVMTMLLVIAGVETNPGPQQAESVLTDYVKRDGSANLSGELFEVQMSALLFLRALNCKQNYQIASNMNAADCFDDIVLKLGSQKIFLQLKHRKRSESMIYKSQLVQLKGDFTLLKYYKSYMDIKGQWKRDKDLKTCGKFEDSLFIVFTNAMLEDGLGTDDETKEKYDIVNTGGKCVCFSEEQDGDIYEIFKNVPYYKQLLSNAVINGEPSDSLELLKIIQKLHNDSADYVPEMEVLKYLLKKVESLGDLSGYFEFLSQLRFCTEQASEKLLGDLIRQEIHDVCGTDLVYDKFLAGIQDWWRNSSAYLSSEIDIWKNIMETCATNITESKLEQIKHLDLKFIDDAHLKSLLYKERVLNIRTMNISLTCLKVIQNLETKLVIDAITLKNHLSEVLAVWRNGIYGDVLVVDGWLDLFAIHVGISDVLNWHAGKKLVIITNNLDELSIENVEVTVSHDSFNFHHLQPGSQEKILDQDVIFQGIPVKIRFLTDTDVLKDVLTANIVIKLLSDEQAVTIGTRCDELECHVARTLYRKECLMKEIFYENKIVLAITGLSQHEIEQYLPPGEIVEEYKRNVNINKNCRFFIIRGYSDFNALRKFHDHVQWIHWSSDGFIWKNSSMNLVAIKKNLKENTIIYNDIETFLNLPQKMILIIGEPGMGKSTELSYLASYLKGIDPQIWIIRINLNDHSKYLGQVCPNTIELIMKAGNINNEFEKKIFKYEAEHTGRIILLIDGFDEISPKYTDNVLYILKDLLNKNFKKIWVTSRPMMKEKLEKELCSLSFQFYPFTRDEQIKFLLKFWKIPDNKTHHINYFIQKLLELTKNSLNDKLLKFTGIPLQTQMLAEVFETKALHYYYNLEINLPHNLDLLGLYIRFVDRKWEVYYEKMNVDVTKVGVSEDYDSMKQMFQQNLMNCALVVLLDEDQIKMLHNPKQIIMRNQDCIEKFKARQDKRGIVVDVINDRAVFIHQTFAEYFAAVWFSENFKYNHECFRQIYVSRKYQIIRSFFDRIMSKSFVLHTTVLNLDKDLVQQQLLDQNCNANEKDDGGRTALHLAVSNFLDESIEVDYFGPNISDIVKLLLANDSKFDIVDEVLCWRPLRLAEEIGAWPVVGMLLDKEADIKDLILIPQNVENSRYIQNLLSVASKEGFLNLVSFMLNIGICIDHDIENGATMLHFAARHGHLSLVKFLVENGAYIEAVNELDTTPLMWAAEKGCLGITGFLIKVGCIIEASDIHGETAFLKACCNGHYTTMNSLHYSMCNIFHNRKDGTSAMHLAAKSRNQECVKFLMNRGMSTDCKNELGETPLMWAVMVGAVDMARFLINEGVKPDVTDKRGNTALHHAVCSDNVKCVRYLLFCGLDIDHRNNKGVTPLMRAALEGSTNVVALLLRRGAELGRKDQHGDTALHHAVSSRNIRCLDCLVNKGLDIDCKNEEGSTPLMKAISLEEVEVLEYLLKNGAKPEIADKNGDTALHHSSDSVECMKCLLDYVKDVNCRNNAGETPLFSAAMSSADVLELLLKHGADLAACDRRGDTAVHCAASFNGVEQLKVLLNNGVNVNSRSAKGVTPLMEAARNGHFQTLELLIKQGADINEENHKGNIALCSAIFSDSVETVACLLDFGLDINHTNKNGETPLHVALEEHASEVVTLLINRGANYDTKDENDNTLLHYAVQWSTVECTKSLLNFGLNINCRNKAGQTPLMLAASHAKVKFQEILIKQGSLVDVEDEIGNTALHYAIDNDNVESLNMLINYSRDKDHINLSGQTPLMLAVKRGKVHLQELLMKGGSKVDLLDNEGKSVLHYSVQSDNLNCVTILLDHGLDIEHRDKNGMTPLMTAVYYGSINVAEFLIKKGAKSNIEDFNGCIALHHAIFSESVECVKLLLDHKLNINHKNKIGLTPLMLAFRVGAVDIQKFLLDSGAAVDFKDVVSNSTLHYAVLQNNIESIKHLLRCNLDVNSRNKKGETPLMYAACVGNLQIQEILIQHGSKIDAEDVDGNSVLHHAVYSGSTECVENLMDHGLVANHKNKSGLTPVMLAINKSLPEIADFISNFNKPNVGN
ncbi:hypothetical protein C0J52_06217 [Blattella germanica]|nr:hypothetical protein C0J52_06217 [Blattella germanica]